MLHIADQMGFHREKGAEERRRPAGWPCGVPPRAGAFEAEDQHRKTNVLRARRAPPPGARTPPGQPAGRRRSAFAAVKANTPA